MLSRCKPRYPHRRAKKTQPPIALVSPKRHGLELYGGGIGFGLLMNTFSRLKRVELRVFQNTPISVEQRGDLLFFGKNRYKRVAYNLLIDNAVKDYNEAKCSS